MLRKWLKTWLFQYLSCYPDAVVICRYLIKKYKKGTKKVQEM